MLLRCPAPAKLNLMLHVTGKRTDGYHTLQSLAVHLEVADTLTLTPADALSLTISGPEAVGIPTDEKNLVLRAANALKQAVTEHSPHHAMRGAAIHLNKILPHGAGIGGGSADAAAALRLLHAWWGRPVPESALYSIGAALGADIPLCLSGTAQWVEGAGELLTPVPHMPPGEVVLVNPRLPIATAKIFAGFGARYSTAINSTEIAAITAPAAHRDFDTLCRWLRAQRNDLTDAAVQQCPEIAAILTLLAAQPGCALARMSGSGSTCFALFAHADMAARAAASIRHLHPEYWITHTRWRSEAPAITEESAL